MICHFMLINQLFELLLGNHDVSLDMSPKKQNLMEIFSNNIAAFDQQELAFFKQICGE